MKQIQAIIRREKLGEVMDALELIHCPGIMAWAIEGHGKQKGIKEQFRGRSFTVRLIPKVKLEIVAKDDEVELIVKTILDTAATGQVGDGKIFVSTIDEAIRIRTGESGEVAVK
jgi:nitrogen regulatory protein P-II 1